MCRFFLKPDGCKNGDSCQYTNPHTNGKCLHCGSEAHSLQDCARPRRRGRQQKHNRPRLRAHPTRIKGKESPKGRIRRTSLPPRLEMSISRKPSKMIQKGDAEPELYFADAQTSDSGVDYGAMPGWLMNLFMIHGNGVVLVA